VKTRGGTPANSEGYTLIEVILFMALSSALAAIAFLGLGPRLRNVRFTDATRTVQSDITKQIVDSQAGVSRGIDGFKCSRQSYFGYQPFIEPALPGETIVPGSSQSCIINGKLAYILKDKVEYHSIVSLRVSDSTTNGAGCDDPSDTFEMLTKCYRPRIPRAIIPAEKPLVQTISNKNGLEASAIPGSQFPLGFGYLQSPNSNNKYFFTFIGSPAGEQTTIFSTQFITTSNSSTTDTRSVCLSLSGRTARLTFKPGVEAPILRTGGCS